jgi:hypothetical protein
MMTKQSASAAQRTSALQQLHVLSCLASQAQPQAFAELIDEDTKWTKEVAS